MHYWINFVSTDARTQLCVCVISLILPECHLTDMHQNGFEKGRESQSARTHTHSQILARTQAYVGINTIHGLCHSKFDTIFVCSFDINLINCSMHGAHTDRNTHTRHTSFKIRCVRARCARLTVGKLCTIYIYPIIIMMIIVIKFESINPNDFQIDK